MPEVLAAARALGALRDADAEGGSTAVLLDALEAVRTRIGPTASPAELLVALRGRPSWERLHSVRALAMALNRIRWGSRAARRRESTHPRQRQSQRRNTKCARSVSQNH